MSYNARERDDTLLVIAHEMRGALAPLRTWARLLACGGLPPTDLRHAGEVLERGVQVMTRLADDLVQLDVAEHQAFMLMPVPVDLRAAVRGVVRGMMHVARAAGLQLSTRCTWEPVPVNVDPIRIRQVIGNLLDNAVKYTDRGGIVLIEVRVADGRATLTVEDTGIGIEAGFLPFVFVRFARQAPDDHGHGGRGVGLHVVKELVEAHGGTVVAESAGPGRGSRFTVSLPLAPGPG
jgi:signal transduction histidine kinase